MLEAGSGGGWQSLALARTGRFETALLDFSTEALSYASRLFLREGVPAEFIESDLATTGAPDFDLVFNAGVLEHYGFEEQVALVRGMKSRSRRYVLVLVPNSRCYWYWIWRLHRSASGDWPWGRETPVSTLADVFAAADIHFMGEAWFGESWTESFISDLAGLESALREHILSLHRSMVLPIDERAYLIGALGSVHRENEVPPGWTRQTPANGRDSAVLTAALADSLALRSGERREIASLQKIVSEKEATLTGALEQLHSERERAVREKHALIRTIDAVSAQAAELQTERRRDRVRSETIRNELTALREEKHKLAARIEEATLWAGRFEAGAQAGCAHMDATAPAMRQEHQGALTTIGTLLKTARNLAASIGELQSCNGELRARVESLSASLRDSASQIAGYQADKRLLEERLAELSDLDSARKRQPQLTDQLSAQGDLAKETAPFEDRLDQVTSILSQKEAELAREREAAGSLRRQFAALQQRSSAAVSGFEAAFQSSLALVRKQRAWRVMLAIRKAYTLWTRHGVRGKLAALRVPFQLMTAPESALSAYDLSFPTVWDYVPDVHFCALEIPPDADASPAVAKFDVIVLPVFDFEFRFQRPQQIASQFARQGHRVFWVSPSRFLPAGAKRLFETVLLRDNLYEVRLTAEPINLYVDTLIPEHARQMADCLTNLQRKFGLAETVVIVQFPFWRQVALELRSRSGHTIVYDCMDDWRNWTAEPRISSFSLNEEADLSRECDVVAVTSAELQKRLEQESERTGVRLRNGVDYEFFRSAAKNDLLANVPRPVVGYYGAIADWVDVELMTAVAAMRPQYSFVIVGEVHGADVSRLTQLPNVHLLGEKHYRLIPSYLYHFDACMLPFVMNQLTRAVDPVKVYEYLSLGKPVVATPLPEVQDHGELVYLAETPEEFATQLDRALVESDLELRASRMAHAESNSWKVRVECLAAAVADTFPLVSIIVVSYNSLEYLAHFLDSVRRNTAWPRYELIVVDNDSKDGSQDVLSRYAETNQAVKAVLLKENLGFAGGNNVAVREAKGEYLVLVNADTVVSRGWLSRLLRPLQKDPQIGLAAPVTNFSGNETRINTDYRNLPEMDRFARELADRQFGQTTDLDMVPLLCAAMARRVWDEVGGLDERFGAGMFEDDDFCLRIRRAGYRVVAVEDCFIHHFGNGSFSKLPPAEAVSLFERNRAYFEAKWGTRWMGHKMRPGVRTPAASERIPPERFFSASDRQRDEMAPLLIKRLIPGRTRVGRGINLQADGSSALVVECENATPGTVIRFGDALLQTAYGDAGMVSAILPAGFHANASQIPVSLVNNLGESTTVLFIVEE